MHEPERHKILLKEKRAQPLGEHQDGPGAEGVRARRPGKKRSASPGSFTVPATPMTILASSGRLHRWLNRGALSLIWALIISCSTVEAFPT